MSEPATTPAADAGTTSDGGDGQQQAAFTPPATQADLDRIISERLTRQKSQFKDYDTFKAAADELAQIKAANQTEAERRAAELTRWQTEAQTWRTAALGNRIEALAAADFADPSDAVGQLDPAKYIDAGGQIDEAAIKADLAGVLERKPHWRKPDGGPAAPRVPAPNPAQGSGGGKPVANPAQEFAAILQGQLGSP